MKTDIFFGCDLSPWYREATIRFRDTLSAISRQLSSTRASRSSKGRDDTSALHEELATVQNEFCLAAATLDLDSQRRQSLVARAALHPYLLCSPFLNRAYTKPLGYAGDYRMVIQMLSDPRQGETRFAQLLNTFFLNSPVAQGHRNRISILTTALSELANYAAREGQQANVLSIGCGPAVEIARLVSTNQNSKNLTFTLVDSSQEALKLASSSIRKIASSSAIDIRVTTTNKSIQELVQINLNSAERSIDGYHLIYCAGLFDYLSDPICTRVTAGLRRMLKRDGRLILTNVHTNNPNRAFMEHILDWHLIHRNEDALRKLAASSAQVHLCTDATGTNLFASIYAN